MARNDQQNYFIGLLVGRQRDLFTKVFFQEGLTYRIFISGLKRHVSKEDAIQMKESIWTDGKE